ncbi:MAG TPA: helix-turn-helix domain-containing protein [Gemmatimonadaceae bacterium]|nr:helix-turn-helix domain-containing protein [Gemmatimonadaceae bacterium]
MVYRQTPRSAKVRATARARILGAAKKLFSERGYDKTTMQDIVREARTSIGNAYFYFSNKEALLESLLEESAHALWARADAVIASAESGAARFAVGAYANTLSLLTSDKDLARIALTGEPRVVRNIVELHRAKIATLFAASFPDHSERQLPMTTAAILGANTLAIELFLRGELDIPAQELAEFLVRWHLRALDLPEREIARVLRIATHTIKPEPAAGQALERPKRAPKARLRAS